VRRLLGIYAGDKITTGSDGRAYTSGDENLLPASTLSTLHMSFQIKVDM
jgi:hypothetical protein